MKKCLVALVCLLGVSLSVAQEEKPYALNFKPANTEYVLYGRDLSEPLAPTTKDTRIAFEISGTAAQEMFDAMPPDRNIKCTDDKSFRFRSRDNEKLVCTKYQGEYSCSFGFDLKTGKSIGGGGC